MFEVGFCGLGFRCLLAFYDCVNSWGLVDGELGVVLWVCCGCLGFAWFGCVWRLDCLVGLLLIGYLSWYLLCVGCYWCLACFDCFGVDFGLLVVSGGLVCFVLFVLLWWGVAFWFYFDWLWIRGLVWYWRYFVIVKFVFCIFDLTFGFGGVSVCSIVGFRFFDYLLCCVV